MRQSQQSRLLFSSAETFKNLYGKQCGPRSDCSYRSSLFWVHAVCFYTLLVSNVRQLFAADDFSRQHFQMHFFLGALRVKTNNDIIEIINQQDKQQVAFVSILIGPRHEKQCALQKSRSVCAPAKYYQRH